MGRLVRSAAPAAGLAVGLAVGLAAVPAGSTEEPGLAAIPVTETLPSACRTAS
jgi:hypothetical protein